jgi:hypothetical protein
MELKADRLGLAVLAAAAAGDAFKGETFKRNSRFEPGVRYEGLGVPGPEQQETPPGLRKCSTAHLATLVLQRLQRSAWVARRLDANQTSHCDAAKATRCFASEGV